VNVHIIIYTVLYTVNLSGKTAVGKVIVCQRIFQCIVPLL